MKMCICKDIALIGMGMASVLLYQKYSEPMKEKVEDVVKTATKKINNKLENMS